MQQSVMYDYYKLPTTAYDYKSCGALCCRHRRTVEHRLYAGPAEERPASVARRADTHRGCVHISDTAGRPPAAIRDTTQYQILF